jgi:isopenicillin-N epimerase
MCKVHPAANFYTFTFAEPIPVTMKSTRRSFIKSMSTTAVAVPLASAVLPEWAKETKLPSLPSAEDPHYWEKIRKEQFLLSRDKVFFNTGTLGAMPAIAVERMTNHMKRVATHIADWDYRDGDHESGEWMSGYWPQTRIREKTAALIHADVKEVALTENVTSAMSYFALGMDLKEGDEVITTDQEHPGGRGAWLVKQERHKVLFREVPIPKPAHNPQEIVDIMIGVITPKTRVIMISHVITGSGAIIPVKEICEQARARGIITVIDGAQALGHIPVDVHDIGCDAYVGCFHKWILGPAGTGFLYIRADRIREIWTALASTQWNNMDDSGYRLTQRGTGSQTLLVGLDAALDFHHAIGHERILERVKFLGRRLREGLRQIPQVKIYSPVDEDMCAAITVYNVDGFTGPSLQDEFWNRARMRPRSSSDIYGVRHCTHIYNTVGEIDRALEIVQELARTGKPANPITSTIRMVP